MCIRDSHSRLWRNDQSVHMAAWMLSKPSITEPPRVLPARCRRLEVVMSCDMRFWTARRAMRLRSSVRALCPR
eukprot:8003002-Pyramimonas_sp.AAC.1